MLRAGPFSDERIIKLANKRFVPFFFDLGNEGAAADTAARKFVVKARPEFGGEMVPVPPVLFMTPEGKVLGEVANMATTAEVTKAMRKVLDKYPQYDARTSSESKTKSVLEEATLRFELLDDDGAYKLLASETSPIALYLRGHIARLRLDWRAMDLAFKDIKDPKLLDDIKIERAYELWTKKDYQSFQGVLQGIGKSSNRFSEARYYIGIAEYLLGHKENSTAIWKSLIKECTQDPWVYRADWAYTNVMEGDQKRTVLSPNDKRVSLLNRIGYAGPKNPDLRGPSPSR